MTAREGRASTRRRWLSRRTNLGLLLLAGAILIFANAGCVSTIEPPSNPRQPVTVFLQSEARHKGLLLPKAEGRFVEYGFGDYDWYALEKDRWYYVFDTVLWPTKGTLGRGSARCGPSSFALRAKRAESVVGDGRG